MNEVDAASVDGRLFIDHHDRYRSFFFVLFFSFLFFFFLVGTRHSMANVVPEFFFQFLLKIDSFLIDIVFFSINRPSRAKKETIRNS